MPELLASTSSDELTEWMAFDAIDPIGDARGEIQAGVIAASIRNVHGGIDGRAATAADFFPTLQRPSEKPVDISAQVRSAFKSLKKEK